MIRQLPENVANQIAAGEVIQRPASAVKELMENAVDAGASRIDVRVVDAGRTLIHVMDNGVGMVEAVAKHGTKAWSLHEKRKYDRRAHESGWASNSCSKAINTSSTSFEPG